MGLPTIKYTEPEIMDPSEFNLQPSRSLDDMSYTGYPMTIIYNKAYECGFMIPLNVCYPDNILFTSVSPTGVRDLLFYPMLWLRLNAECVTLVVIIALSPSP